MRESSLKLLIALYSVNVFRWCIWQRGIANIFPIIIFGLISNRSMQAWLVSNQSMKCSKNNFCNEILATDLTVDFIFFHGIMAQCNVNIPNCKDYRFCHSLIFWHLERIKKRYFAWLYHNIWLIRTSFWFLILTIRHSLRFLTF